MRTIRRWLGMVVLALAPLPAWADSVVTSLALAQSADCTSNASVNWSFTYTVTPTIESFSITTPTGPIGGFQLPSTVGSSGSFTGVFNAPILIPQQANTLIGTYGTVGDFPPTNNTAVFFVLYNCSTRQVVYQCSGNASRRCPTTATEALAIVAPAIPTNTPALVVATLLLLGTLGGFAARRRARG